MLAMVRSRDITVMTGTIGICFMMDLSRASALISGCYWVGFVIPASRVVFLGFLALELDMDCFGWGWRVCLL